MHFKPVYSPPLNTTNDNLAGAQNKGHGKKMAEDPLISDEFKMVQKLWSAYFADLKTKLKLTAAKLTNHKTHIKVSPTIPVQVLWQR